MPASSRIKTFAPHAAWVRRSCRSRSTVIASEKPTFCSCSTALIVAYAAIDASDHFPLTLEAGRCRDFIPIPQDRPWGLLQGEHAFQLLMPDPAATMPECFGEDLIVSGHRYPLEHVILSVLQRG